MKVRSDSTAVDFETFWNLLKATASRAGFGIHPKAHYRAILDQFKSGEKPGQDGAAGSAGKQVGKEAGQTDARIVTAGYQGKVLAALLVIYFGDRAIYVHGGSAREHATVMAPFAAQWYAIRQAKEHGCRW